MIFVIGGSTPPRETVPVSVVSDSLVAQPAEAYSGCGIAQYILRYHLALCTASIILPSNSGHSIFSLFGPRTHQGLCIRGQDGDGFGRTPPRWSRKEPDAGHQGASAAHHGCSRFLGCGRSSSPPHCRSGCHGRSCWRPVGSGGSGFDGPSRGKRSRGRCAL